MLQKETWKRRVQVDKSPESIHPETAQQPDGFSSVDKSLGTTQQPDGSSVVESAEGVHPEIVQQPDGSSVVESLESINVNPPIFEQVQTDDSSVDKNAEKSLMHCQPHLSPHEYLPKRASTLMPSTFAT